MERDTRNQPNSTYTAPRDTELCNHHHQLRERVLVLEKEQLAAVFRASSSRWSRAHPCVLVPACWESGHVTTLPAGHVVRRAPEKMHERPSRRVMPTAGQRAACPGGHVTTCGLVPTPRRVGT